MFTTGVFSFFSLPPSTTSPLLVGLSAPSVQSLWHGSLSLSLGDGAAGKSILLTSSCDFVILCKVGSIRVKAGHIRPPPLLLTDIASWETRWSGFISEAARTLYIKIFQNISWWVCFGFWFTYKQLHIFPLFLSFAFISRPLKCRFFFFRHQYACTYGSA